MILTEVCSRAARYGGAGAAEDATAKEPAAIPGQPALFANRLRPHGLGSEWRSVDVDLRITDEDGWRLMPDELALHRTPWPANFAAREKIPTR